MLYRQAGRDRAHEADAAKGRIALLTIFADVSHLPAPERRGRAGSREKEMEGENT